MLLSGAVMVYDITGQVPASMPYKTKTLMVLYRTFVIDGAPPLPGIAYHLSTGEYLYSTGNRI